MTQLRYNIKHSGDMLGNLRLGQKTDSSKINKQGCGLTRKGHRNAVIKH